jgi:hypothetical protein
MTLGGLKMGSECHHHYATHYRNQWRSLPPYPYGETSYAKRLQELASHSHSVQNIFFTRGDRFCHSFVYDNQSTWKNFDSFGSEHKPIHSENKPIRSEHKPICPEHKPIRSENKPIRSEHKLIRPEHKPIRSEHKPIRSEHKLIRPEHKPIRSEHKPIRSEHKPIRPEHKSLRHPRKISLVKGVH